MQRRDVATVGAGSNRAAATTFLPIVNDDGCRVDELLAANTIFRSFDLPRAPTPNSRRTDTSSLPLLEDEPRRCHSKVFEDRVGKNNLIFHDSHRLTSTVGSIDGTEEGTPSRWLSQNATT